jgi:hypothetical protein
VRMAGEDLLSSADLRLVHSFFPIVLAASGLLASSVSSGSLGLLCSSLPTEALAEFMPDG